MVISIMLLDDNPLAPIACRVSLVSASSWVCDTSRSIVMRGDHPEIVHKQSRVHVDGVIYTRE